MPKKPLFILGYPRSGTTLLGALVDAHPEVTLFQEPEVFRGLRLAGYQIGDTVKPADRASVLEKMLSIKQCRQYLSTLPEALLNEFLNDPRDLSFAEAYEYLLPRAEGQEVWGVKGVGKLFYIRDLHALYPDALFIYIVRDPRAAILSYYRKRKFFSAPYSPAFNAKCIRFFLHRSMQWRLWADVTKEALGAVGEDAYVQVRYEDLVTQPEAELRRICAAARIDFAPSMLEAANRKKSPVLNYKNVFAHKKLGEAIDSTRAAADEELPAWASRLIERYAGSAMQEFGYASSRHRLGPGEWLRLAVESYRNEARLRKQMERDVALHLGKAAGAGRAGPGGGEQPPPETYHRAKSQLIRQAGKLMLLGVLSQATPWLF